MLKHVLLLEGRTERAMKVQEVMLRAWAKKITWWQAAEILGVSDRHHGIGEGKTATGRPLTGMLIWRTLMQAELDKFFSLGSAWARADEKMLQLDPQGSQSTSI